MYHWPVPLTSLDLAPTAPIPGDINAVSRDVAATTASGDGRLAPFLRGRPFGLPTTAGAVVQVGVGVEEADQAEVAPMAMGEACQGVRAIAPVAGEDELTVGEPMDQDRQQLPHQFRGRLVPPRRGRGRARGAAAWSWPLGLGLGFDLPGLGRACSGLALRLSGRYSATRTGSAQGGREGERDQDRQDDPFVPPAIGGEGVGRADRVAVAALAVDLGTAVLVDRIVAGQEDRPVDDAMIEDERRQDARQRSEDQRRFEKTR